jgi:hypothetical protein
MIELAALSEPGVFEVLTPQETEQRLEAALAITHIPPGAAPPKSGFIKWIGNTFSGKKSATPAASDPTTAPGATAAAPGPVTLRIEQSAEIVKLEKRSETLKANQTALAELHLRAFPLHRPVIDGYQQVIGMLIKGRTKGLAARLDKLAAARRDILDQMARVEDHLDWLEATSRQSPSGTFEEILRGEQEPAVTRRPRRDDPISRYLDEIEREFE